MLSRTEHKMRMCFDPDYAKKWEELENERRVLVDVVKSYYRQQHPLMWFTLLAVMVAFIATGEPALIGPLILPAVMLVIPIGYALFQYAAKRRRLGL